MNTNFIENAKNLIFSDITKNKVNKLLQERLKNNSSCDNLYACFDLQAKLILLQIFAGDKKVNIDDVDLEGFDNHFEEIVVNLIEKLYSPKNKKEFFNIVTKNYFTNGYMYHGTSSKHYKNIFKNGLNGKQNFKNVSMLKEVNEIFSNHKKYKCFEGKINVLESDCYYVSDRVYGSIYYAYQSPEYLSRFCANGYVTRGNEFDTFAYFRRDKKACYQNLKTFCKKYEFSLIEKNKTLSCFKKIWKENVVKNESFYLCLIPRKLLDREEKELVNKLAEKTQLTKAEIIQEILKPRYIHDKTYTHIMAENILFLPLLDLHKSFKNSSKGIKYVTHDCTEYIYDLVADFPYLEKRFYIFNQKTHKCLSNNLYLVSKDEYANFVKANCELLANICTVNTPAGEDAIKLAQSYITLDEYISNMQLKAQQDLKKIKSFLNKNIDKSFEILCNMLYNYFVIFKAVAEERKWFSSLDIGRYYISYWELDRSYLISKAKKSGIYDKTLIQSRVDNIEKFLISLKNNNK